MKIKDPSSWVFADDSTHDMQGHRRERIEQGFSKYDWWNFDQYIAFVIAGAMKKFAKESRGYPGDMTYEEWTKLCKRLASGFARYADDPDSIDNIDELLALFSKHFQSFWD